MTTEEFAEIAYMLKNGWPGPHQFSKDNEVVYFDALRPYDFDLIRMAIHKLIGDGAEFLPAVGKIVSAARALQEPVVPSWAEAWEQIVKAMDYAIRRDDDKARAPGIDDVVWRYIEAVGMRTLRLLPIYDNPHAELRLRVLEERWREFVDVEGRQRTRSVVLERAAAEGVMIGLSEALALEAGDDA